jgi:hypothetical protein
MEKRKRPWKRVGIALLLVLVVGLCLGSTSVLVMADQTTFMGVAYLNSVRSGNVGIAELLGDHFSDDSGWHQKFYATDIQRDMSYLHDAEVTNVIATREQTLSGQWVTIVRFNWREPGSTGDWHTGAMRVKTGRWLFITYINAVELVE